MKDVVEMILGAYVPLEDSLGAYHIDWPYLFGGILFCISVYSLFRIIGGLFKG